MVTLNFTKLPSDQRVTVWHGPSGGSTVGITDISAPTAAELNDTGGTSDIINVSKSVSWNDWGFGTQASETTNEPSFADAGAYTELGAENYGGEISYFLPSQWDDNSNIHSLTFDLTRGLNPKVDIAVRIDGDLKTTVAAADGQFVSTYRVEGGADANPFTPGESKRHTRSWFPKSDFAHFTVVGAQTITAIPPSSFSVATGKGRIRASQGGRDTTNRLVFSSDDVAVIEVYPGGFFNITGAATDTANVTITDPASGETATVSVTLVA